MTYSKDDLARDFELPDDEVTATLKACGVSTRKKSYSEAERERFAAARRLFREGTATSYDDVEAHFRTEGTLPDADDTPSEFDPRIQSAMEAMRQEAIAQGFRLGMQNAEIIGHAIPHATMLRLLQMIENGELREDFERLWAQAFPAPDAGKPRVTREEIDSYWTHLQISGSQTNLPLPESSTESSDSE